ncbi:MAG: LuxR C-terminal-related transcriptional regulator [Planctomycetes bacterium]|nr:LuxR C-terminal-related transcriptional regulator [Planctomycetota bacterium]
MNRAGDGDERLAGGARQRAELDEAALPPLFRLVQCDGGDLEAPPLNPAAQRLVLDEVLRGALRRLSAEARGTGRWRADSVVDRGVTWLVLVCPVAGDAAQALLLPLTSEADPSRIDALAPGITPREREVLVLSLHGRTPREIAADLGISWHTVRTHLKRAYRALGVSSRAEALSAVSDGMAPRVDIGLIAPPSRRPTTRRRRWSGRARDEEG